MTTLGCVLDGIRSERRVVHVDTCLFISVPAVAAETPDGLSSQRSETQGSRFST